MDIAKFHELVEGEALYCNVVPEPDAPFEHFIDQMRTSNQLFHAVQYAWALRVIQDRPGPLRVLDAACGTGYGTNLIGSCENVSEIFGLDANRAHLEEASQNYTRPVFLEADLTKPIQGIEAGSIDVVTSFQTLEHVMDPTAFIRNLSAMLKPGGVMLLGTPTHSSAPLFFPPKNPYHLVEYDTRLMRELVGFFFEDVRFVSEVPFKDTFDLIQRRLSGVVTPEANFSYLAARKAHSDEAFEAFRTDFLIRLYQKALHAVQDRLVETRRQEHFLSKIWQNVELVEGFYNPELGAVWTQPQAVLKFTGLDAFSEVGFSAFAPKSADAPNPYGLRITHEETRKTVSHKLNPASGKGVVYSIKPSAPTATIRIEALSVFRPAAFGARDLRDLGVSVRNFFLKPR